jgi:hypothetical protein
MASETGRKQELKQRRKYLRTRYRVLRDEAARIAKPVWCGSPFYNEDPVADTAYDRDQALYRHVQERLKEALAELELVERAFKEAFGNRKVNHV